MNHTSLSLLERLRTERDEDAWSKLNDIRRDKRAIAQNKLGHQKD
jgi:hypothetical protein